MARRFLGGVENALWLASSANKEIWRRPVNPSHQQQGSSSESTEIVFAH